MVALRSPLPTQSTLLLPLTSGHHSDFLLHYDMWVPMLWLASAFTLTPLSTRVLRQLHLKSVCIFFLVHFAQSGRWRSFPQAISLHSFTSLWASKPITHVPMPILSCLTWPPTSDHKDVCGICSPPPAVARMFTGWVNNLSCEIVVLCS